MTFKVLNNIVGWAVFAIAVIVYALTAEPTGSLWDCGEFIAGAQKLQVVHPPGAPLFLLIGRMFTWVAEIFSDNPTHIAYAVNLMSGICTAFVALFVFWSTTILSRLLLVGKDGDLEGMESIATLGAGAVAGLATTFASSIWFSAVEGEVYAMSTFFTAIAVWGALKWYQLPNTRSADRWLVFVASMIGLSIGVHLLSLLTIPAIALLVYFKKFKNHNILGIFASLAIGVVALTIVQSFIILKLPKFGAILDRIMVNGMNMPVGSGLILFVAIIALLTSVGIYFATKSKNHNAQVLVMSTAMIFVGFSTYGTIVLRAKANTPINMNNPSHAYSLISYLNREQYGDRPLLRGPQFDAKPERQKYIDRYGMADGKYAKTETKLDYIFKDSDKILFPRMGHVDRANEYRMFMAKGQQNRMTNRSPNFGDNVSFFVNYQVKWMYWRYFMWNFAGRQNSDQGFLPWDPTSGNWISGIGFLDNRRLYNQSGMPDHMKQDEARNRYYLLPFLIGLLGMIFHFMKRPKEAMAIMALFLMTGLAIIVYSNQPPTEPRERDYVLAGSFFTYCMWIGLGVTGIFSFLSTVVSKKIAAPSAIGLCLLAPLLMGSQNWDDHSRAGQYGARDYASNFLQSCEPNAIIFTYGDNDTYPLWYAQEVEGIRTDVRVVNFSLLAVDWYIDQLRRKVNDSEAIAMSMKPEAYRGSLRNQLYLNPVRGNNPVRIDEVVKFMSESHPLPLNNGKTMESYVPTNKMFIPVDKTQVLRDGYATISDTGKIVDRVNVNLGDKSYLIKDELAMLDILATNAFKRPIYFAVTVRPEKLLGLKPYLQLEGMALKLVPVKSVSEDDYPGLTGAGRVGTDAMYDNVVNKFKWGNFDKKDVHISPSYMPSVSTSRLGLLRLSTALIEEGKNQKAIDIAEIYFSKYPPMNFPYEAHAAFILHNLIDAGGKEQAKDKIRTIATRSASELAFYEGGNRSRYFGADIQKLRGYTANTPQGPMPIPGMIQQIQQMLRKINDPAFTAEIEEILGIYKDI